MKWVLQKYKRDGGISGEGVKNLLEASGFRTREDLIVREALQNSVDAHDDVQGHKVRITLRKETLRGKKKSHFVSSLSLRDLSSVKELLKSTPTDSPLRELDDPSPLSLLYIEDFNTKGLGGGLTDLKGNYYRLLFLIGDAMKAESQEDLGGSYGYGKSVYASNSGTSTIVAFSVFEQSKASNGHFARLLGSTFQKAFSKSEAAFTGRGWFGADKQDDGVPDPVSNLKALELAQTLGFTPRSKSDYGTSILIIGTEVSGKDLSMDALRESMETWWWPRYIEDRLDITLMEDGKLLAPPRPRQRPDLAPFVDCYLQLKNGGNGDVQIQKFNAHTKGAPMGSIALKAVAEDAFVGRDSDYPGPGARKVALMRSPLMVVEYHTFGTEKRESFAGVYKAAPEIDSFLRLSEPKEHHRWDPNARRLQARENGQDIVQSVLRRCQNQVREFQASLAPKKERPVDRLDGLDKLLGAAFNKKLGGGSGTGSSEGKAFIEFPDGIVPLGTKQGMKLDFEVRMKLRDGEKSPQQLNVKAELSILEDANRAKGRDDEDAIPIQIVDRDSGAELASGIRPAAPMRLYSNKWVGVRIRSGPYSTDWLTQFQISVE